MSLVLTAALAMAKSDEAVNGQFSGYDRKVKLEAVCSLVEGGHCWDIKGNERKDVYDLVRAFFLVRHGDVPQTQGLKNRFVVFSSTDKDGKEVFPDFQGSVAGTTYDMEGVFTNRGAKMLGWVNLPLAKETTSVDLTMNLMVPVAVPSDLFPFKPEARFKLPKGHLAFQSWRPLRPNEPSGNTVQPAMRWVVNFDVKDIPEDTRIFIYPVSNGQWIRTLDENGRPTQGEFHWPAPWWAPPYAEEIYSYFNRQPDTPRGTYVTNIDPKYISGAYLGFYVRHPVLFKAVPMEPPAVR
ncbi:MAG: hypothetical protein ABUL49_00715 [bacterium]